jgi:hypothetical protein
MTTTIQREIIKKLAAICELTEGVRVGQVMDHLGLLGKDMFDRGLADLEDDQLLRVLERHEAELVRRQSSVA